MILVVSEKHLLMMLKTLEFELQQLHPSTHDIRFWELKGEIKALKDVLSGLYSIKFGRTEQ